MDDHTSSTTDNSSATAPPLKTRFLWIVVGLFWIIYLGVNQFELYNFTVFLSRLALIFLTALVLTVWWVRNRRFRLANRWSIVALIVLSCIGSSLLLSHTVMPLIPVMWSIPAIFTLGTLWLTLTATGTPSFQVVGLAVVCVVAWLPGLLVRMEGLTGSGTTDIRWRWSPSSEDILLSKAASDESLSPPADLPATTLQASQGDWTAMRGPAGDSRVPGLVISKDWSSSPPQLIWKRAVGPAWSSILVVGDRIFTQEQRGDVEFVTCYSADSGEPVWSHQTPGRFEEPLGGVGPRATPTLADGRIFAFGARGNLDCLNAVTGKSLWTVDAMADNEGRMPMWGFSSSPAVVDNLVIVFVGGETKEALVAYDVSSGQRVWQTAAGVESYSSPIAVTIHGVPQVLYLGDKKLVSVDPSTGRILWEHAGAKRGRPTCQPQRVGQSQLLISFAPYNSLLIEINNDNGQWSSREVWDSRALKPDFNDYVIHNGAIYGFDGTVFACVDLESGKRRWKKGRYGAGQVLLLPDMPALLVTTEQGELVLLDCNPDAHTELAKMQAIEGKTWNHPSIAHGRLYVRNAEEMACYQLPVEPEN
jgi:outer membrane protein assembly factor BamB